MGEASEAEHYNTIQDARFTHSDEVGHHFSFAEGAEALVAPEEFREGEVPRQVELLIEQPTPSGVRWIASARKAEKLRLMDEFIELAARRGRLTATVCASNRGGLSVDAKIRGFVPWSQVELGRPADPSAYLGRSAEFEVIEFDAKKVRLVLSRRALLEAERAESREATLAKLEPGRRMTGTVRSLKPYGAFVDLGGVEGLLHVSNMAWSRVGHPRELVSPGDEIEVVVLSYDAERERIDLGKKQLQGDPWEGAIDSLQEGAIVQGVVRNLADFGAFVEILPGVEGLVHLSELSWEARIAHPREVVAQGEEIQVKILVIDRERRRLSLSLKEATQSPWIAFAEEHAEGERVRGTVRGLTDFGIFVELAPGIEGLVHVSNLSWTERDSKPEAFAAPGDEIEVAILAVDAEGARLDLGIKQLEADPWSEAAAIAVPGQKIEVTITRVVEFGAFAEIVPGVEGLIHVSEMAEEHVEDPRRVVRPGQRVEALVLDFERGGRRASLSLWRDELEGAETETSYQDDDGLGATSTLGDLLRTQLGLVDEPQGAEQE